MEIVREKVTDFKIFLFFIRHKLKKEQKPWVELKLIVVDVFEFVSILM